MSATTEASQEQLEALSARVHGHCVVCGPTSRLGLRFRVVDGGDVEADVTLEPALEGYDEILHGGIVASLLDAAMTNCLFARGVVAVTGELVVRYRRPVRTQEPAVVRGHVDLQRQTLWNLSAQLAQNGTVVARATGKFLQTAPASHGEPSEP